MSFDNPLRLFQRNEHIIILKVINNIFNKIIELVI